jgi:hypothetical protein
MTQFGASLRFAELPAVAELLANLGSTGRLTLSSAESKGEILVRRGQIVGAFLGGETGKAALEAIALGFHDGELSFVDELVGEEGEPLVADDERAECMERLNAERRRLMDVIPSLALIPRLVELSGGDTAEGQVTVGASALQLVPALASGQTIKQLAAQRGLARTLRDVATLLEASVISLSDTAPAPKRAPVATPRRVPAVKRLVGATSTQAPAPAAAAAAKRPSGRYFPVRKAADKPSAPRRSTPAGPSSAAVRPSPVLSNDARDALTPVQHLPIRHALPPKPPTPAAAPPDERLAGWRAAVIRLLRSNSMQRTRSLVEAIDPREPSPRKSRRDLYPLLPG